MGSPACRSCSGRSGNLVLDLGNQPACDYFPECQDPGPDPGYPLQMWLCSSCGLTQLLGQPTVAEEPRGIEPAALVAQAADAVERLAAAGWLSGRSRVVEFSSPHGGSWLGLLADRGLAPVSDGGPADLVIDSFGMMHNADQSGALAERVARVAPGGILLLQYHSLGHDHPSGSVERSPAWALRVLLDQRSSRHAGRQGLQRQGGVAIRPLRRHGATGGQPRAGSTRRTRRLRE